jgi:capsular exopolysaccharide synthesis family protein
MGKTHEALERAEKDYQELKSTAGPTPRPSGGPVPRPVSSQNGKECYQSLKINLLARYPDKIIKTLIFCGTAHGDGSTTTATNFATTLARDCKLKVLLVDANLRTPRLNDIFRVDRAPGLSDYIGNGDSSVPMIRAGRDNFYILPCGSHRSGPISLFEAERFDRFLKETREQFDYVILDAPPVPHFAESRVICPKVDGVILVVGSGKTRRQVALRAKKELEEAGGRVLGIVINRRKYPIPEWIYKRL